MVSILHTQALMVFSKKEKKVVKTCTHAYKLHFQIENAVCMHVMIILSTSFENVISVFVLVGFGTRYILNNLP